MKTVFSGRAYMRTGAIALIAFLSGAMAASAAPLHKEMPEDGWVTYKNDEFGYSLYYPSTFFEPQAIAAEGEIKTFLSPDKKAKIDAFGAVNDEGYTLARYRETVLNDFGDYDSLDYSPKGKTWFVLSGYRGENIYYQKVLFSCAGRIINAFNIRFPKADRAFYEPLIELMEDRFRPGRDGTMAQGCQ